MTDDSAADSTPEQDQYPVTWSAEPNLDQKRAALKRAEQDEKDRKTLALLAAANAVLWEANANGRAKHKRRMENFRRGWGLPK